MTTLLEIITFILDTLTSVLLTLVILRFLLQLVRADFYNPLSQAIVKITNPLLIPFRKVIPGFFGIDFAAIVLALCIQVVFAELIHLLYTQSLVIPTQFILWGALGLLKMASYVGLIAILILVVSSFVAPTSRHPALLLVNQLIDPLLRPVRRVIPPIGGLDFSVMAVGMGIYIVQKLLDVVAVNSALRPLFVIGY